MKDTLNLFDYLLAEGKRHQALGRHRTAGLMFTRLASFRDLPAPLAEEAQVRLAELALKRRRYSQARRHLTAALQHQPSTARYHFLMALAMQADDRCDPEQAAEHYRRALELEPGHLRCRCNAGLLELSRGRTEEGLALLRQAVERAPDNVEVVGKLVKGLLIAGQTEEAQALRLARFRNPKEPRFRKLWLDVQVQMLRRERETEQLRQDNEEGPVLLPFVRPGGPRLVAPAAEEGVRQDEGTTLPPPHQLRLLRRSDRRRVQ